MPVREYDAIVVGASFAGLAVARQLRGDVLLLDRNEVGAVQTSACGTPLWVPQALGVADSVLQVHDRLTLRTPTRTVTYDLSAVPFCTFDYRRFCRGLLAQTRARFLRTPVTGLEEGAVSTGAGRFTAPVIVDCSGWRGALINARGESRPAAGAYSFGLETRSDVSDNGLSFWLDQRVFPRGLGWVFPVGKGSLVGLGSYTGFSRLRPALEGFLRDLGATPTTYHGTFFPNRLLRATAGRLFAVGDAAGQCLPLTAEGIRPALYFGSECGKLVQQVIEGGLALGAALERYRRLVERYRRAYRILGWAQLAATHVPTRWFAALTALAARRPFRGGWWPRYGWFGPLDRAPRPSVPA
jgi:flavin-dependent dehydrogenase